MKTKRKPRFKSVEAAERRVRLLEKRRDEYEEICQRYERQLIALAKLAATGPAFYNPLEVAAVEELRDRLLRSIRLNPDGSIISTPAVDRTGL